MPKKRAKSSKVVNKNNRTKNHNLDSKVKVITNTRPTAKNNVKLGFNFSFPTQTPQQTASFHHFPNQIIQPAPIHVPYVIPQVNQPSDLLRQTLQKEVSQINLPKPVQIQPAKSSVDTIQDEKAEVIFPDDEKVEEKIEEKVQESKKKPGRPKKIPQPQDKVDEKEISSEIPVFVPNRIGFVNLDMPNHSYTTLMAMKKPELYNLVSRFSSNLDIGKMTKVRLADHYRTLYNAKNNSSSS